MKTTAPQKQGAREGGQKGKDGTRKEEIMYRKASKLLVLIPFIIGGFAFSTAAQTISGCANNLNGQLRRITPPEDCKAQETPLNWSVQGPAGLQGPAGPQGMQGETGATGASGASGLSKGYFTSADFGSLSAELVHAPPALLKQLQLPAGSYLITAKLSLILTSTSNSSASCTLSKGPNVEHFGGPDFLDTGSARDPVTSAIQTIGTIGDTERSIALSSVIVPKLSAVLVNQVEIQ